MYLERRDLAAVVGAVCYHGELREIVCDCVCVNVCMDVYAVVCSKRRDLAAVGAVCYHGELCVIVCVCVYVCVYIRMYVCMHERMYQCVYNWVLEVS